MLIDLVVPEEGSLVLGLGVRAGALRCFRPRGIAVALQVLRTALLLARQRRRRRRLRVAGPRYQQTTPGRHLLLYLRVLLRRRRPVVLLADTETRPHAVVVAYLPRLQTGHLVVEEIRQDAVVETLVMHVLVAVYHAVQGEVQVELLPDVVGHHRRGVHGPVEQAQVSAVPNRHRHFA